MTLERFTKLQNLYTGALHIIMKRDENRALTFLSQYDV